MLKEIEGGALRRPLFPVPYSRLSVISTEARKAEWRNLLPFASPPPQSPASGGNSQFSPFGGGKGEEKNKTLHRANFSLRSLRLLLSKIYLLFSNFLLSKIFFLHL